MTVSETSAPQKYYMSSKLGAKVGSCFFEIARPTFDVDHRSAYIEHAQLGSLRPAVELRVSYRVFSAAIPQATERQRIGDQIDATLILSRSNFVKMGGGHIKTLKIERAAFFSARETCTLSGLLRLAYLADRNNASQYYQPRLAIH
jgi:hypothetical protein